VPSNGSQPRLEDILENIARLERFVGDLDEQGFYTAETTQFSVQYAAPRRRGGRAVSGPAVARPTTIRHRMIGASAESVGRFRLRELTQRMIQGDF
jgi:hypothetical protein